MSGISQTIPNYVLGISEQPDQLKSQGQVRDLVNALPDVSLMLVKRQGSELVTQLSPDNGVNDANEHVGKWFDIYRDDTEQYMGVIRQNGTVQIWRLIDGPVFTYRNAANTADVESRSYVNITNGGTGFANGTTNNVGVTNINGTGTGMTVNVTVVGTRVQSIRINRLGTGYDSGDTFSVDGFAGTVGEFFTGTAGEECHVHHDNAFVTPYSIEEFSWPFSTSRLPRVPVANTAYLQHTDSNNIKTLTVNDTTIFVNRGITTAMGAATEPDSANEGFVVLDQLVFLQEYTFLINQGGTISTIVSDETTNQSTATTVLTDLRDKVRALANFNCNIIGNSLHIIATAGGTFSLSTPDRQMMTVFTDEVQDIAALPDQSRNNYRVKVANSGALEDDYYVRFIGANGQDGQGVWEEWRGFGVQTGFDAATMPHIMVRMSDASFLVTPANWDEREVGDELTNPTPSFIGSPINNVCLFRNRVGFISRQNIIFSRAGDFFNFFVATALTITPRDPIDISASAANPATLFDTIEVNAGLLLFSKGQQFMLTTDNDILSTETAKINFVSAYDYNINLSPITLGTSVAFINDEAGNSRLYEMQNPPREGEPEVVEVSKIVSTRLPTGVQTIASSKTNSVVFLGIRNSAASTNQIWGYRYFNTGERRIQNAWFRFTIPGEPIYQCIIQDTWYGVVRTDDTNGSGDNIVALVTIDLIPNDATVSIPGIGPVPILVNLDNRVQVPTADLTYNAANDQTTFDLPFTYAETKVTGTDTQLTAFQTGNGIDDQCVDISTTGGNRVNVINAAFDEITLEGNWRQQTQLAITTATAGTLADGDFVSLSCRNETGTTGSGLRLSGKVENGVITSVVVANSGTGYVTGNVVSIQGAPASRITLTVTDLSVWIGYNYTMEVDFPTIYPVKSSGANSIRADVQGSLIIHRCKFNTGATGTFSIELGRTARPTYTALHESRPMDAYQANNVPLLLVDETTIPCYERNTNINLSLKSKYPLPVTLISMTWEGEYTNKNYRRT